MKRRPHVPRLNRHELALPMAGFAPFLPIIVLVVVDQVCNVFADTGFALSGKASSVRTFVLWQIFGSLFGLGTQLCFAGMVRFGSVRFANSIDIGLAFLSAQMFSAYLFFHEPFTREQWMGTALIVTGVLLLARSR